MCSFQFVDGMGGSCLVVGDILGALRVCVCVCSRGSFDLVLVEDVRLYALCRWL